ncbi:MAG: hypothetical protein HWD57_12365 [Candidatus Accumulibacter cognatus]|uniref:Uncharacterized protein n=1 Tax=Candidatus Accumulibacter cognatus TaxID=2954383 RepID=A0A7D5SLI1_9PROT|nr:MAG: hypothetical protein HWD57_12365 [Candidatus Accumulibacter cognatus]
MRKHARPQTAETSARDKADPITVESIKARILAGEIVGATDYPESDRPLFWAAIAIVQDDMPRVRPFWQTTDEQHVAGTRVRQKLFKMFPRQKGDTDPTLIGLVALAATCLALICARWPL